MHESWLSLARRCFPISRGFTVHPRYATLSSSKAASGDSLHSTTKEGQRWTIFTLFIKPLRSGSDCPPLSTKISTLYFVYSPQKPLNNINGTNPVFLTKVEPPRKSTSFTDGNNTRNAPHFIGLGSCWKTQNIIHEPLRSRRRRRRHVEEYIRLLYYIHTHGMAANIYLCGKYNKSGERGKQKWKSFYQPG